MRRKGFILFLFLFALLLAPQAALATEGGSSYYFPGVPLTFASGIAPHPGYLLVNQMLYFSGSVDKAVLGGKVDFGVDAAAFYNFLGLLYAFEEPVLGGRLQIGAVAPVGWVDVEAQAEGPQAMRTKADNDSGAFGDVMLTAALYWKGKGNFHYKLSESIFAPTGHYTAGRLANVGRNYWAFDTVFTVTWLDMASRTEISLAPGIMFNLENPDTDYESGTEFHVDFAMNKFLTEHLDLAVGLHGYYYKQLSGDSGSGALLGDFKGESYGIGPAIFWSPKTEKGKLSVILKWMHDLDYENRLDGDYGQLIVAYQF